MTSLQLPSLSLAVVLSVALAGYYYEHAAAIANDTVSADSSTALSYYYYAHAAASMNETAQMDLPIGLSYQYYEHTDARKNEPVAVSHDYYEHATGSSDDSTELSSSYYNDEALQLTGMFDTLAVPEDRLKSVLPLIWLHVPKTGSSIANALLRLPGVCPALAEALGDASFSGGQEDRQFGAFYDEGVCPGLATSELPNTAPGFHRTVGSEFESLYNGRGVIMLRHPEQRIISALRHVANATGDALEALPVSAGCTVRMLVDEQTGPYPWTPASEACFVAESPAGVRPPPAEDVREAQERLSKFAFVGLMEEWHLSICLLHAMFGGDCSSVEFENTRPSPASQDAHDLRHGIVQAVFSAPERYDVGVLGGFVDEADRAVYDSGAEIFWALCGAHGVTPESCEPCFRRAGML